MAKKRKQKNQAPAAKPAAAPKPVFESPFKDLKKMIRAREAPPPPAPPRPVAPAVTKVPASAAAPEPQLDDATILRNALAGVRPLNGDGRARMPLEPPAGRAIFSEDAEVMAQLSDLVSGQAPFDITESDEYVEGCRVGLDPRLVSQLRRGDFALQAHLDLHGMVQPAAKEALQEFILASVRKGHRTVLVVHGRGLRSPGGRPVLKHATARWLTRGEIGAHVLAFTTSRATDGGAGAMYVLLRRDKQRAVFDVLQGAKRR
jgi:DNA-nicking Smr family endonuclease